MAYEPIFNSFATRPKSQYFTNSELTMLLVLVKDNFELHTWLLLGAVAQGLICLLPYRNIALISPVILFLTLKLLRTALITAGLLPNPNMAGTIPGKTAIMYPSPKGTYDEPASQPVCAIVLAVRSNHPLGMFGPGYKEVGDYFRSMIKLLDANATKHGYLGSSAWLSASDRTSASEFMSIVYFENEDFLHNFAHGELHTKAVKWWDATEKEHGHVSIMHEVFAAPRRGWEGIYANYHPTGMGKTSKEVVGEDGRSVWMNPLVRIGGQMRYSKGRMGRKFDLKREWGAMEELSEEEKGL